MSFKPGKTFVPDAGPFGGSNRQDTAILLVGTAKEFGLGDRAVFAVPRGFYISDTLADLLASDAPEGVDGEPVLYHEDVKIVNDGVETGPETSPDEGSEASFPASETSEGPEVPEEPAGPGDGDEEASEEVSGNEPETDEDNEEEGEFYDPADYSVAEVKATITETDDTEFASGVLDAEVAGKNRPSLTKWLTEFINASGNRAEENNTNNSEEE